MTSEIVIARAIAVLGALVCIGLFCTINSLHLDSKYPWEYPWRVYAVECMEIATGLASALRLEHNQYDRADWMDIRVPFAMVFGMGLSIRFFTHGVSSMSEFDDDTRFEIVAFHPISPISFGSLLMANITTIVFMAAMIHYLRWLPPALLTKIPIVYPWFVLNGIVALCDPLLSIVPYIQARNN